MLKRTEYHLDIKNESSTAVELLASESGLSKQKIKQAMKKGAVWLSDDKGTHRLRRQSAKLNSGGQLHFYYDPSVIGASVEPAMLIADEDAYSIWYKPQGMLSQGSKWGDHCAINRWVEQNLTFQRPVFIVHRLDRFASGLILLAHKKKIAATLSRLFEEKKIQKKYKAIVKGKFPKEKLIFQTELDNKTAISHAFLLEYDVINDYSLLQIKIETGRKHQIRRHLSKAGFPLIGDRLYGGDCHHVNLQLTAFMLSFCCPVSGSEKKYVLAEDYHPKLENLLD